MGNAKAQIQEIVNELKEERKRRNVSQQEIADAVGVSRAQVGHWEAGRDEQQPNLEFLGRWVAVFGWDVRVIVEREPGQAPAAADDFASVVGRLATIWRELPESARRGLAELIRGLNAMTEKR